VQESEPRELRLEGGALWMTVALHFQDTAILYELWNEPTTNIEEEEGDIWPQIEQAWDQSKLEHAGLKRTASPGSAIDAARATASAIVCARA